MFSFSFQCLTFFLVTFLLFASACTRKNELPQKEGKEAQEPKEAQSKAPSQDISTPAVAKIHPKYGVDMSATLEVFRRSGDLPALAVIVGEGDRIIAHGVVGGPQAWRLNCGQH